MTQQVKMPEPVAWLYEYEDGQKVLTTSLDAIQRSSKAWAPLITTDQAEAYAAAKVREALEAVIQSLERESDKAREFQAYAAVLALMSQAELIRVQIEKQ